MRPSKLKLNEKQKGFRVLIGFLFTGQSLLLQHWKFAKENFFVMLRTLFPIKICIQIGICKQVIIKNFHRFRSVKKLCYFPIRLELQYSSRS